MIRQAIHSPPDGDRRPAPGSAAEGRLHLSNERGFADLTAATGEDGGFTVRGVPQGTFDLEVTWRGHKHWPSEGFTVRGGDDTSIGTLALGAGAGLSGRIADGNGRPLSGVRVRLRPADTSAPRRPRETTTNAYGEYAFVDLRRGVFVLTASLAEHATAVEEVTVDAAGIVQDLALTSHPAVVVRLDGEPIPSAIARIQVRTADGRPVSAPRTARIGEDRTVRVPLPPGRYQIAVEAGTLMGYTGSPVEVDRRFAGETTIEMREASAIAGRILDRRGEPIRSARLTFVHVHRGTRHDVTGGADGRYRLSPVEAGIWRVHVGGRGGVPATFEVVVEGGKTRLEDFVLEDGGTARVKVVTADGTPQPGVTLLFRDSERAYPVTPPDRTGNDGFAVREHLPPGPIRVDARLDDWAGSADATVTGNTTVEIVVTIGPRR